MGRTCQKDREAVLKRLPLATMNPNPPNKTGNQECTQRETGRQAGRQAGEGKTSNSAVKPGEHTFI